jgi:hypothetical protein
MSNLESTRFYSNKVTSLPLILLSFNFEAAVCGGIPIIHSLHTDFLADEVTSIMGIMNGTVSRTTHKPTDSL